MLARQLPAHTHGECGGQRAGERPTPRRHREEVTNPWNNTAADPTIVTALGQAVTLTPPSLTFAAQAVGTFSPAQSATLNNTGGATLKISSIGVSGDFNQGYNCGSTLAPGASCTLRVIFTPTSTGTRSGSVTIADNAPGSPHILPLSGTGSGTGSIILQLSPSSLSFGSVAVGT